MPELSPFLKGRSPSPTTPASRPAIAGVGVVVIHRQRPCNAQRRGFTQVSGRVRRSVVFVALHRRATSEDTVPAHPMTRRRGMALVAATIGLFSATAAWAAGALGLDADSRLQASPPAGLAVGAR